MRLFCLPFALVELYEPAPGWTFVVTPTWELEVVAAHGRTVARWLDRCGRVVADVGVTSA